MRLDDMFRLSPKLCASQVEIKKLQKGLIIRSGRMSNDGMPRLAIIILFAAHFCLCVSTARAEWSQYDPVLRVGGSGWRNILFLFWSHTDKESARALREVARKLNDDINSKRVVVLFYQIAGPGSQEVAQASIFLCAPRENYGRLVIRYLDLLTVSKEESSPELFARLIKTAVRSLGLPDNVETCSLGRAGGERAVALNVYRNALKRNYPFNQTPVFVLNGRIVGTHSVGDLQRQFLPN